MIQKVISKKKLQTYIFMAALLLLSSCKKNASDITSDSAKKTEAKQIILSSIASKKKIATEQGKEKLNNLIKGLDFEALKIEKETDTSSIIVVPAKIRFETLAKINNSLSYYLIIKVVKGNVGSENIVAFKPENAEPKNLASNNLKIALNRKNNAENGLYIFMNYTGTYLYSLTYESSQLQTVAFPFKKHDNSVALRTETETVCVDWYHVTYYYDDNGYFLYKEEEYLYQTCYSCGEVTPWGQTTECDYLDDDPSGGGDINYNAYFSCTSVSEMGTITTTNENATTRTKAYPWTFVKNSYGMWRYNSIETGVQKKINNIWQWESLTHSAISRHGIALATTLDCVVNSAIPQVGIYNAGMQLNFTVTGTAVWQGSPVSLSYNGSSNSPIWNIND